MQSENAVFVVDDDPQVRRSLTSLLEEADLPVQAYAGAQEFLQAYDGSCHGCLVLDLRMPGLGGMELLERLSSEKIDIPTVVISGYGNVSTAVRAMKTGAIDFIEKPFRAQELLSCIRDALALSARNRQAREEDAELAGQLELLTPRERQVMSLLAEGNSLKEVASELGRSYKTVDKQTACLMRKLDVHSRTELVRLAIRARVVEV